MQQLTTNRLYYNKYKYKVECFCCGLSYYGGRLATTRNAVLNWDNILRFDVALGKVISTKKKVDYKTRCERGTYSFFFNDPAFEKDIVKRLGEWVISVTRPGSDAEGDFLDTTGRMKTLCDQFPRKKYRFKVILKYNMLSDRRTGFLSFIGRLGDIVHHSGVTTRWFENSRYYSQDPFIYVKDDKNLSMILLYLGDDCRRVIEYIPRSSINT